MLGLALLIALISAMLQARPLSPANAGRQFSDVLDRQLGFGAYLLNFLSPFGTSPLSASQAAIRLTLPN